MARIEYDIVPSERGWRVKCNGVLGPPYSMQSDAVQDTLFVAAQLMRSGDKPVVRLLELGGLRPVWRSLKPEDSHLYRSVR